MAFTTIQTSFGSGEISPSLWGREDFSKIKGGASTMRNFFVNYRGGATSRGGLAYCGMAKQAAPNAGTSTVNNVSGGTVTNSGPPRDIPFQYSIDQGFVLEFGDYYMRIKSNGAYVIESALSVSSITQASPGVVTITSHGYSNGDWVYGQFSSGMTEFNALTFIVQNVTTNTFTLTDLFGNAINTTSYPAFTSGTFSRLYTVTTIYAAADLKYLKYTQSANTMSLTCVNQATLTEYPPQDLQRVSNTDWVFTVVTFATSAVTPTGLAVTAYSSTTVTTYYSYVVTSVSADGEESEPSSAAQVENNDISIYAGSNTLTWSPTSNASTYNIYSATPTYGASVPVGVLYGLVGSSLAPNFVDTNITADFTQVPPSHTNPFARGQIEYVTFSANGHSYSQSTVSYTVSGSGGSGFVGTPIVNSSGGINAFLIQNPGQNYPSNSTISFSGGSGTGATASLTIGAQSGTYPSVVAYYQQRRAYASTLNNPGTYYMSQPGAYLNMDSSIPTSDSDAIVGAPWAQQINGIQFMVPMPGGLVIFAGNGAWQLNGGSSAAITPSDQDAVPQAYGGCSQIVPPIPINYSLLFVESKQSLVYELEYNYFVQIYLRSDKTVLSNHLFDNYAITQWAYSEQPYKIIWALRNDGTLLSLTYLKEQQVEGWARHDTNGLFQSVCCITETANSISNLYTDALYAIVQRYVLGQWVYYSERMDPRLWNNAEQAFCVDAGLTYAMSYPAATLTPSAAQGTNNISGYNLIFGGEGYTAPVMNAIDPTGAGTGFVATLTVTNGVITGVLIDDQGQNYAQGTQFVISDTTGTKAVIAPIITNKVAFTASAGVFSSNDVGAVLRCGGGIATITSYVSSTQVVANITQNITATVPNDPNATPIPQIANSWSLSFPTQTVTGLNHLEGLEVAILADGSVSPNQTVTNNSITLPLPASQITVGLPYTCQLQTLYLDPPNDRYTSQGKRKNVFGVTVRVEQSRGLSVGANQVDSSTQPNYAIQTWSNLEPFKERDATIYAGQPIPLFTGDEYLSPASEWTTNTQIAIEQDYPLPASVLAVIAWYQVGDTSG